MVMRTLLLYGVVRAINNMLKINRPKKKKNDDQRYTTAILMPDAVLTLSKFRPSCLRYSLEYYLPLALTVVKMIADFLDSNNNGVFISYRCSLLSHADISQTCSGGRVKTGTPYRLTYTFCKSHGRILSWIDVCGLCDYF